ADLFYIIQGPTSAVLVDNSHYHRSFGMIIGMGETTTSVYYQPGVMDMKFLRYLLHILDSLPNRRRSRWVPLFQRLDKSEDDGSMPA
ncbi:hypothetical protein AbraIFM66950_003289, partial [Aspergillus brasiliensis]